MAAETIELDGRTLAFERSGAGPPLVVLNGFAATRADWDPAFIAGLEQGHELFCLDNRGVGDSSTDGRPFEIEDLARDVAAVLDELELDRAAVLGWSMGGFIALALANARPDRLGALVLLAASPGSGSATRASDEVTARLLDASGTPREQAGRLISLLFTPDRAPEIDREFGSVAADARAALSPEVIRQQADAMERWHSGGDGADLSAVRCPTLVATGSEDVVIPPANALALAAGIRDSWLARFPGAGHGFMADRPGPLSALIRTFLYAASE